MVKRCARHTDGRGFEPQTSTNAGGHICTYVDRGESEDLIGKKAHKRSTLALKPRTDITRSPKQGYQWPHKRTSSKDFKKSSIIPKGLWFLNTLE